MIFHYSRIVVISADHVFLLGLAMVSYRVSSPLPLDIFSIPKCPLFLPFSLSVDPAWKVRYACMTTEL